MKKLTLLFIAITLSNFSYSLEIKSNDLKAGSTIPNDFVFSGMGCEGKNLSPEVHWTGAPKETKGFALTVYDPDAPTGSGWWHWIVIDIPTKTTALPKGWSGKNSEGGVEITSDFGTAAYGGPCPPPGKPHNYIFTIHALNTDKLGPPQGASNAYVRFMIEAATLKKASFKAQYGRK